MEIYKIITIVIGSLVFLCSIFKRLNLPAFFCLDRIFGSFFSTIFKIGLFIAISYIILSEIWKRVKPKEKEGALTKAQLYSNMENEEATKGAKTMEADAKKKKDMINNLSGKNAPGMSNSNSPGLPDNVNDLMKMKFPDAKDIPSGSKIPKGQYAINFKKGNTPNIVKMMPIPNGCKLKNEVKPPGSNIEPEYGGIVPIVTSKNYKDDEKKCPNVIDLNDINSSPGNATYDVNNLNDYASIRPEIRGSEKEAKQTKFDVDLKLIDPYPIYYEPGSFPFNSAMGYQPNYEDSIYLSRTTNLSQTTPITQASYLQGGFCTEYATDNLAKNQKCTTLDPQTCASTSCCVLMGGTKCVAGSETGASNKPVYSDMTIQNRDYWYYQGKCYGNCP